MWGDPRLMNDHNHLFAIFRMKEINQPIKLECYRASDENRHQSIGSLNIRLRQIPFWNVRQTGTLKPHWYKLYGVPREFKSQKPELFLCVTIGDPETTSAYGTDGLSEMQCSKYTDLPILNILVSQLGLSIQPLANNVIQLGTMDDECREFTVKIHLKYADQLEQLLSLSANNRRRNFAIEYRLFNERCIDAIHNELTGRYSIDETITISFRSTWPNFLKYFREIFYVECHMLHEDEAIGSSKLSFGTGLMNLPMNLVEFEQIFASDDMTFRYDDYVKIIATDQSITSDAFLHYTFQLQYVRSDTMEQQLTSNANEMLPVTTDRSRLSCTSPPAINFDDDGATAGNRSGEVIGDGFERNNVSRRDDSARTIPRTFSYDLALIDCTFQRRPNPGIWQFRYGPVWARARCLDFN